MIRQTKDYKGIVIDAGHGGVDSGSLGNGIIEKDLNLKIATYIHDRLNDLGIKNVLIRSSDETVEPNERVRRVLNAYGNGNNVIVVSNHINAGGGDGSEVIYALRNDNTLSNLIAKELEKEGQNIRRIYQRRLPNDTTKDYYYMLRNTPNTEAIIIEYGFLDSKGDDVSQLKANYEKYAEAVVRALIDYIGATYIPVVGKEYYIVKKGDTLWSIAKKLNLSLDDLKNVNNLSTNSLTVGQVLKIPGTTEDAISNYIVKPGDTLYGISNQFGVSIQDLINLNNLTSTNLVVDQQLKINANTNFDDNSYIVTKGDTLYAIASKYGISVQDILDANNLTTSALSIGQKLIIPDTNSNYELYTVISGDTLYNIANKFDVSVNEIKQINNLKNDFLSIGQKLKIPINNDYKVYIVQKGDSLYSISRKYNTTVTAIQSLNNLTTSVLTIGQKLLIPNN